MPSVVTITEALAEIKTINARLVKKREGVGQYLVRDSRLKDPMEQDGGTQEYIRKEDQAIKSLEERIVTIRCAIQAKNLEVKLQVGEIVRPVAAWLNWRREVSDGRKVYLNRMASTIENARRQVLKEGRTLTEDQNKATATDVIVNISEKELRNELEHMEQILGELDGKLSLLNATTTIEVVD